jgi:hypothetical protein
MKKISVAAIVGVIVFAAGRLMALDGFQQNARLGRGVNILGWDPV